MQLPELFKVLLEGGKEKAQVKKAYFWILAILP